MSVFIGQILMIWYDKRAVKKSYSEIQSVVVVLVLFEPLNDSTLTEILQSVTLRGFSHYAVIYGAPSVK